MASDTDTIVVVGGGLASARFATEYRAAGGEASVTILSSEEDPPYHRPPLTKGFLRGEVERDGTYVRPAAEYEDDVVELRLNAIAERIDPQKHVVLLEGGEEVPYARLVVATGARPRPLPLPGADLVGIHTYRFLPDAATVRVAAEEAHSAIVVGGSFIGAESAASLRLRGLDVTLIEMGPRLMPQLGSAELSAELADFYREQGVEVLLETELAELTGNGKLLTGARTKDGVTIEGYLAIVGIGVVPNVELAQDAGAEVDDGIVVDERFRASLPDVYAVGDVARYPDPTSGRLRRIEHWSSANAQGGHLGRQLAGSKARYDELPVFFTQLFDETFQVIGDPESAAESIVRGSLADGRLVGYHLTGEGQLVGAVVHGESADVVEELKTLVRERPTIDDPTRLTDEHLRPAEAVGA
ncbi:FAD/NAD(P)-binding oxidoreductase [Gaiella sp.]|jgi:NADPH-dependent 2,4-dienoyl-CoA reductase/sulfur reductase-like enzyme|uniref:NAD(P)/FAD-dependent oxidoreductase n=1 Tax=Gaiella sp. TaxID=2663207 RepID=UPI002E2F8A97|nr:FAD/NAD(P)-binding oxidoreductase [Gaiella sp.]HEX5583884.1 FAD/NAD(P)-binding oxidoreductase [Gaiella sp.]